MNDHNEFEALAEYGTPEATTIPMTAAPTTVKDLADIDGIDAYLLNFGRILGKKAIDSLNPLHVPNRDPLISFDDVVEFNPDREPFPCQAHLITAGVKMFDEKGSGFLVGEMGCIAGESEVYDPVANEYRVVSEITEPFHVIAWDNGRLVAGKAHVPFIKGQRELYRVTMSNGRTFVATDHHRILTNTGWQLVSSVAERLRESGHVPLPSIGDTFPSGSTQDAPRSSRRAQDCPDDFQTDYRSCGEQPRLDRGICRVPPPLQGDALELGRYCSQKDDPAGTEGRTRHRQSTALHSRTDSSDLTGHTIPSDASESCASGEPCGQAEGLGQDGLQSAGESLQIDTTRSSDLQASRSCEIPWYVLVNECPASPGEMVHVTSVVFERFDDYYDFTVDEFRNYVMDGVVHHNTGKTLLGMLTVHKHAQRSGKKGGTNGNYRAIVLCPDHLIAKWEREILETIPKSSVTRFGPHTSHDDDDNPKRKGAKGKAKPEAGTRASLRDTLSLLEKRALSETFMSPKRWRKPIGAEWFVMGRNQAKWLSDWAGMSDVRPDYDDQSGMALGQSKVVARSDYSSVNGTITGTTEIVQIPAAPREILKDKTSSGRTIRLDRVAVLDANGYQVYDDKGRPVKKTVTAQGYICPKCGAPVVTKKGLPASPKDLSCEGKTAEQRICTAVLLKARYDHEKPKQSMLSIPLTGELLERMGPRKAGTETRHAGRTWDVVECGEPLYNWVAKPYRWAPSRVIQKKMRGMFKYLVIDEVHEQKSDESGQSMACGKLMAGCRHILALTGTLIGGYAEHLFPLMMRITPKTLIEEGFEWGKSLPFSEVYGRIDRVVKTSEDTGVSVKGGQSSMRRAKNGKPSEKKYVRPGIMPPMFGKHLIGTSMFITLEELADELPSLYEYIGGPAIGSDEESANGYFDTACHMEPQQHREYKRIEQILAHANRELLRKGSMKLLGSMLWTLTDYPDRPFGWEHPKEVSKAISADQDDTKKQAPGLLGQSFLNRFGHRFDAETTSLVLTQTKEGGFETDIITLKKEGGVYWLDVTFNGKETRSMIYDTGASSISMSDVMAAQIGLKPKKGDSEGLSHIADGSIVPCLNTTIDSVTVGKFTVKDVKCSIDQPKRTHTIGYWDKPGDRTITNWVGVVTPRSICEDTVYPKEQALIDICKKQKADCRQTWVYVHMTNKRNIQPRLKKLLEAEGLKVGILRSGDVDPKEREEWIIKQGKNFDVMLSHPQLVSTGLDLFSKSGSHNYSTLVFYETGYNLFTMRQASRRAWRIGQPLDCRVYYLYYLDSMQHKAMSLMSKKMAAAQALEGEFSADGLAAMAGDDNLQMSMAKSLADGIDEADLQRNWVKIKSGGSKKLKQPMLKLIEEVKKIPPSQLDDLPIELQAVAETIIEVASKKPSAEVLAEIDQILASQPDDDFEDFFGADDDFDVDVELTPEIMAKMFQNLMDNA